jgi:hypothetical protein
VSTKCVDGAGDTAEGGVEGLAEATSRGIIAGIASATGARGGWVPGSGSWEGEDNDGKESTFVQSIIREVKGLYYSPRFGPPVRSQRELRIFRGEKKSSDASNTSVQSDKESLRVRSGNRFLDGCFTKTSSIGPRLPKKIM